MRSLILATASVIALGLGSAGAATLNHGYSSSAIAQNTAASPAAGPATAAPPAAAPPEAAPPEAAPPAAPAAPSAAAPPPPAAHRHRPVAGAIQHRRLTVKEAQRVLRRDGLYRGAIDGILGPETRRAVAHYQRMHRLPVTANLNHRTLESLLAGHTTGYTPTRMHRSSRSGQMPPNATGGQGMEPGGATLPNNVNSGAAAPTPGNETGSPGMGTAGAPPVNPPNNVNSGAAAPAPQH